jgi:hypothetical protein
MLTVWRRLHIEVDSMTAVPMDGSEKNHVTGEITVVGFDEEIGYLVKTNKWLADVDMYEGGKLWQLLGQTLVDFPVLDPPYSNDSGPNASVGVSANGQFVPQVGPFDHLKDDDVKVMPSLPDLGKLTKVLKPCYVEWIDDAPGGTNNVAFNLNIEYSQELLDSCSRGSSQCEGPDYWVVYVLGAYQGRLDYDKDPNSEDGDGGSTDTTFQVSAIFLEDIADRARWNEQDPEMLEQQIVAHEIGHQLLDSDVHTPNTIMAPSLPVEEEEEKFSAADVVTIRKRRASPGL